LIEKLSEKFQFMLITNTPQHCNPRG